MKAISIIFALFFKLILPAFVITISACGGSSKTNSTTYLDYMPLIVNGYYLSSTSQYDTSGKLISTLKYTLDPQTNVITRTSSISDDVYYLYYGVKGEFFRAVKIDEVDLGFSSNLSSNSYEMFYAYNDRGLITERTADFSRDGDIDTRETWHYNENGFVTLREFDADMDGRIDITRTYTWSDGRKVSKLRREADGSTETTRYFYTANNLLPSSSSYDINSDGSIEATYDWIIDSSNNLTRVWVYDSKGALVKYYIYDYQSSGAEVIYNHGNNSFYFY